MIKRILTKLNELYYDRRFFYGFISGEIFMGILMLIMDLLR
jgi:tetrahydromethanopterin S-methyltransferase subunit B